MNLQERDKAVIWHPFTPFKFAPNPIPIVSGKGIYLTDESGNRYLDAISSWWVTLHGHAHPYIAEKIYKQALSLEQVIFAGFTHRPAIELAERLLPLLPGAFSKIFYSDNGSTSTEVAVKMALQYWWNKEKSATGVTTAKRKKILAFNNSYHGDTFGAMSVSDRSVFTLAFHDKLFEVVFIDTPTHENLNSLLAVIAEEGPTIAAFIYEPLLQGAGGMKLYASGPMNALLAEVKKAGILCIADEVMTGFGRTGNLFASSALALPPDIICLSKGLTGGTMALGVTAVTAAVVEAFQSADKLQTFFHGHSFTANPIACAAALASLDLLQEPSCMDSIDFITSKNRDYLSRLSVNTALPVKNPRQLGTILAFEINRGNDEYLNDISVSLTRKALAAGIYLRPLGNTVYIMPPYCITGDELNMIYRLLDELVLETATPPAE